MKKILFVSTVAGMSAFNALAADGMIPPSPFENGKVILNQGSATIAAPSASGSNLIALMDMDCVQKEGVGALKEFDSEITLFDSTPKLTSHRKILKLKVKKPVSEKRLSEFANSSACIIGISNDAEYHVSASFSDPMVLEQDQHAFLHTADFYKRASWLPTQNTERAVIAVIDTGVNYFHPDLYSVMYRKNSTIVGASFVDGNPDFMDDHGHGSHVSGLAAADSSNGIGGAGVCGMSCYVMPIKVLDAKGSGLSSSINNGVYWAVDHGADVLNLSLGRTLSLVGMAPMDLEAFRYAMLKNVSVAVAAGNEGSTLSMDGPQSWPAMFGPLPGLVTVASVDALTGALSTFSNRSSRYVDIAAPGSASSTNGVYVGLLSTSKDGGYVKMSGTSMATPIVAGSMGLIVSYFKKAKIAYTPWDVEAFLKSGTRTDAALTSSVEAGRVLDLTVLADRLQSQIDHPFRLNVQDSMERFVNDLYYVLLRRDYDTSGAKFFLGLMKQNRVPLETLMLGIFRSPEFVTGFGDIADRDNFRSYGILSDHFIPDTYLTLLGRLPNSTESDYWSTYLGIFKNKHRQLIRAIVGSPEYQSRVAGTSLAGYPALENVPSDQHARCVGKNFPQGNFSFETQVDFGYCIALERVADAGGKAFFVSLLKGGYKLEDLYLFLFKSQEFKEANDIGHMSDHDYVVMLYYMILQRMPKDYEAYYWEQVLKTQPRDVVLSTFLNADEFKQVLKAKGIRN